MENKFEKAFTIFTPCYNGEKTINRVFQSVFTQTYKDFEWIIINDGSTDDSSKTIMNLINSYPELSNKIIFLDNKINQGKHKIWNIAVSMSKGELFLPADCDDCFEPDTLAFMKDKWTLYKSDDISGINVCCGDPYTKQIIGLPYPTDELISNNIELVYKYHILGEKWGCIRTDLLKKLSFPDVKGHFFPESYLWFSLAKTHKVICFNKILRLYYDEPSSICNSKLTKNNKDVLRNQINYTKWTIKNVGGQVFSYSWGGYIRLWLSFVKNLSRLYLTWK